MSKRARLSPKPTVVLEDHTNPFSFHLFSKPNSDTFSRRGGKPPRFHMDVTLSIPSKDEECPLTLDAIADSKLTFMPDTPFVKDRPNHTKITLPCKHSFSAMTLLYSFCKNNMVCPCCRAGEDVQADTLCLPTHIRSEFKAKIQETLETERRQDDERGFAEAVESFSLFGVTIPYEVLGMNGNLNLVANFYDIPSGITALSSSIRPMFSFSSVIHPTRDSTGRLTMVPTGQMRTLNNITQVGVNSIQLSTQLSMHGTGDILIDSTPISRLPDMSCQEGTMVRVMIPGASSSSMTQNNQFQVLVQLQNNDENPSTSFALTFNRTGAFGTFNLNSIAWMPGTENLEILSSSVQLSAML